MSIENNYNNFLVINLKLIIVENNNFSYFCKLC